MVIGVVWVLVVLFCFFKVLFSLLYYSMCFLGVSVASLRHAAGTKSTPCILFLTEPPICACLNHLAVKNYWGENPPSL